MLTTCKSDKFLTHLLCAYYFIFLTVFSACGGWRWMSSWSALRRCILGFGSLPFNLIGFLFWFMGRIRPFWILCFRKQAKKLISQEKKKISVYAMSIPYHVLVTWLCSHKMVDAYKQESKENFPLLHKMKTSRLITHLKCVSDADKR